MPHVSPLLSVDDIARSMDYYERVLGFKKGLALPGEGGKLMHGEVHMADEIHLMFMPPGPVAQKQLAGGGPKGAGVILYLDLGDQDIDRYYEDVKRAGAKFVEEITDQFWGDRNFTIEDPDGYVLTFSKHVRDVDFSQMQHP